MYIDVCSKQIKHEGEILLFLYRFQFPAGWNTPILHIHRLHARKLHTSLWVAVAGAGQRETLARQQTHGTLLWTQHTQERGENMLIKE